MFAATFKTPQCPWRDVYAVGALQFQSVYGIRCSNENIKSLIGSPAPEILYYNRPFLSDFVVLSITYMD